MGLVKTRRLAAMQKQTTYAKVTVVRQRARRDEAANGEEGPVEGQRIFPHSRPPKIENAK